VILSDISIREELESGGIVIDPLGEGSIQPSSVDLHVDRYFRVFRNDTTPYIDPKQPQEDLTELVEVDDGRTFILHPGEFVLGSTLERVALSSELVARLEGKSSLGRLGLLIHSSLPASEPVLVLSDGQLAPRSIDEIVRERIRGSVVGFDPDTFEVAYHEITGWYEGPPDRIYEVRLASGRRVRVTAGHNLFTIDGHGRLAKTRTLQLRPGARVAIPRSVPDSQALPAVPRVDLVPLIRSSEHSRFMCTGPTVAHEFEHREDKLRAAFRSAGLRHFDYYRERSRLPLSVAAQIPGLLERLGPADALSARQSSHSLPPALRVDSDLAWLLGLYVAEGSRRRTQVAFANTDEKILRRVEEILTRYGVPTSRAPWAVTACSALLSEVFGSLGMGDGAHSKRVPARIFGWPGKFLEPFFDGLVDGDGSRTEERTSVWTSSERLVSDVLTLAERLGRRAGSCFREREGRRLWQVYFPNNEHKLLTSVPLPDRLLVGIRQELGVGQATASRLAGYKSPTSLANIENRTARDAVRLATLRRLRATYSRRPDCPPALDRLNRLVDGDLLWDVVVEIRDTRSVEPIFDLEVQPAGRRIENFLAGHGGVFVSNTAGFVDAGWDGHLTLELSNVANLPIAIYPGMKIGQISFLRMTTPAEEPYGSEATASKYRGQRGPTPSRYYLNFPRDK
jgi:deoxycytidine triphosphate deaminase/intein/homing endonuclease